MLAALSTFTFPACVLDLLSLQTSWGLQEKGKLILWDIASVQVSSTKNNHMVLAEELWTAKYYEESLHSLFYWETIYADY